MSPKIQAAIRQFEEIFQGEDIPFTSYDPVKKDFILVATGSHAEHYHKAVKAIQEFGEAQSKLSTDKLVEALNRKQRS